MTQITCPSCSATYQLSAEALSGAGRKVRCASCRCVWIARTEDAALPECDHERAAEFAEAALAPPEMLTAARDAPPPPRLPWHQRIATPAAHRSNRWPAVAAVALLILLAGGIGLRKQVVRIAPETAKLFDVVGLPVNLRGLELAGVRSGMMAEGTMDILVVQGMISNVTAHRQAIPAMRFSVRDARNVEVYAWTANADVKTIDPGQTLPFRRRLASPPPEGASVLVRFVDKPENVALAP